MSKHAAEFVALVTDGRVIDGFGLRCDKCGQPTQTSDGRKERFLKLGRAVMKDLAKLVGVDPKEVCVNPAGCAVSGDVYAYSSDSFLYVNFSQTKMGVDAFLVRCGDTSLWMKWEELLDLPKLAEKVAALLVIERTEES